MHHHCRLFDQGTVLGSVVAEVFALVIVVAVPARLKSRSSSVVANLKEMAAAPIGSRLVVYRASEELVALLQMNLTISRIGYLNFGIRMSSVTLVLTESMLMDIAVGYSVIVVVVSKSPC